MKLNLKTICPLILASIITFGSGILKPSWGKDLDLIKKLEAVSNNQFETRLMLANYSVDWGGQYPATLQELFQAAKKGSYWKAIRNPITGQSGDADLGMDYAQYRPDLRHAGKVLYEPLKNAKGEIHDFRLYAVNDEGHLLKSWGKIQEYSDHSSYKPSGLHAAAAAGQLAPLQKATSTELNALDRFGLNPLMWAALNSQTETVQYLRAKGARFVHANRAGYGEAYLAVKSRDSDWVKEVIANEKDLAYEDEQNTSALVLATEAGRLDWVQAMLVKGVPGAERALKSDAALDNEQLFTLLLEHTKVDVQSALIATVLYGDLQKVRTVLEKGARVELPDSEGRFALEIATHYGELEIVEFLLANGARADQPDSEGRLPLETAASQGHLDIVQLLLTKGADVNAQNTSDGWTALMRASYTSNIDVLNVLLSHGARIDQVNHAGETALIIVAQGFSADVMHALLQQGADPSIRDQAGHQAIYYARDKSEFKDLMAALRTTQSDEE